LIRESSEVRCDHFSLDFNPSLAAMSDFGISPEPHCRLIKLFWPASHFPTTGSTVVIIFVAFRCAWRSVYFRALPAIPPVTSKNHFSLFAGWRQPEAYFRAWVIDFLSDYLPRLPMPQLIF